MTKAKRVAKPVAKKRGRPVDPGARRERVLVRATPSELAVWEAAAAAAGLSLGTWMWTIANNATKGNES